MARPGFLGGNAAQNVQATGNVRMFFQLAGQLDWVDLGNATAIEIEPLAEFLEYSTNAEGVNAVVKRILTSRGMSMNLTLEEINPDNLRFAFLGGSETTVNSVNALESAVLTEAGGGAFQLSESALDVLQVVNEDGSAHGRAIVHTPGASSFLLGPSFNQGSIHHVVYEPLNETYPSATLETPSMEILDSSLITGAAQFRIRNPQGGLAQIYEIDSIELAPNGAVGIPIEEIQSLPLVATAREVNGTFGRVYSKTVVAP